MHRAWNPLKAPRNPIPTRERLPGHADVKHCLIPSQKGKKPLAAPIFHGINGRDCVRARMKCKAQRLELCQQPVNALLTGTAHYPRRLAPVTPGNPGWGRTAQVSVDLLQDLRQILLRFNFQPPDKGKHLKPRGNAYSWETEGRHPLGNANKNTPGAFEAGTCIHPLLGIWHFPVPRSSLTLSLSSLLC